MVLDSFLEMMHPLLGEYNFSCKHHVRSITEKISWEADEMEEIRP